MALLHARTTAPADGTTCAAATSLLAIIAMELRVDRVADSLAPVEPGLTLVHPTWLVLPQASRGSVGHSARGRLRRFSVQSNHGAKEADLPTHTRERKRVEYLTPDQIAQELDVEPEAGEALDAHRLARVSATTARTADHA